MTDTLHSGTDQHVQVLIVDNERVNRCVVMGLLRENGISCGEAQNGQAALSFLRRQRVDLILLDVHMPGMDGFQLLNEIRSQFDRTELSIIMITAHADSSQVVRALQRGANDYICKPINHDELLARVRTQLDVVAAQQALRESEERYALTAKATNDGLWDWDLLTGKVYYSDRWRSMLGLDKDEPFESIDNWFDRVHEADLERVQREFDDHLCGNTSHLETELRMLHADGSYRWMQCRGLAFRDANGEVRRMAGSLSDVSARKVVDALTSLPNRMLFLDRLQRCIKSARRNHDYGFAVLFIDLDSFKLVNDSLGHEVGDRLLITIANRLESSVRGHESVVGRLGGDEFAVLLENVKDVEEVHRIANRILQNISEPCVFDGQEIFPAASIGITVGNSQATNAKELIREADTAMYEAKSQGKARVSQFHPNMLREVTQRLQMQTQLRRALLSPDQLELHYQPIVNLHSGRVIGFEALLRWHHPDGKLVPPNEFIPIAEETGLVVAVGRWAIERACRQLAEWNRTFPDFLPFVSVNVASRQLVEPALIDVVQSAVKESGIKPAHIKLEVTESAIMNNADDSSYVLSALRDVGVKTGIDDFGTGYSSLACLHRLPIDLLKVDRSFVARMTESSENEAIVRTILTLSDSLSLDVIAEGIETVDQVRLLQEMGCRHGQGFLYSKPLEPDEVTELLQPRVATPDSIRDSDETPRLIDIVLPNPEQTVANSSVQP